ncbi:MAG TPA: ATP-binding protein [Longimicrobiaceae bacterium]|nr:ATP-binding protein [Longimicrobiaceae bacterium]
MSTRAGTGLHPSLRAFPGVVLELLPDGTVADSNGRLDAAVGRPLVGHPLAEALDGPSARKLERALAAADGGGAVWELVVEGGEAVVAVSFSVCRSGDDGAERVWLVECPRDSRVAVLHDQLHEVNSELVNTQRELGKEKGRLVRALDELEREFHENDRLSQKLQRQNEEMEAQNEELLAMTEELHAGQEQLLRLNHQLERRTRELQVALSARNRFYAAMSHELRTPINAIMGYNDLLLASVYGRLGEQQETAVERSQAAARHLRELVNDILDISRLELGKFELQPEPVDLQRLVEDLFVAVRPLADGRGSTLHLVSGDAPCRVVTDLRRVRQIVLNLLSNAVKFGNGEPVMVRCGRSSEGGAELEVVDGGDGIAAEDLGRIFEDFVQLGTDVIGGAPEGTGLGLPISRRLANLLGGRLEVSSTAGLGSTFRLVLPPSIEPAAGAA